jgi:hypothetical protein
MRNTQNTPGEFIVSDQDQELIANLLTKINNAGQTDERIVVITRASLSNLLTPAEISIVDRIYDIDPKYYGFRGPELPLEPVPPTLVRVEPQPYRYDGEQLQTRVQFVPPAPYRAYRRMARAMEREIGRKLLIESSYRSPTYQALTFLRVLKLLDFDVPRTAQRAAIPGYSEHGTPSQLALDLQNVDGLPSDETPQDFEGTLEYNWLINNALRFKFYMSYPRDNPYGVMFEPWHWRHIPQGTQ